MLNKPKMPKEGVTITVPVTLTVKLDMDPERYSSGSMRFKFQDTTADVMQGDKKLGAICGTIGGGIVCELESGRNFFLGVAQLWEFFQVADAAYLQQAGK